MQLVLDLSANTFGDDLSYIMQMIDEIKSIDTGKHEIIFKTQLFKSAPPNVPLKHEVFDFMYNYGKKLGYQVTSSVFDKESLDFLLGYDVPFIKLANNRDLDWLIGEVPRKIPIYFSIGDQYEHLYENCDECHCFGDNVKNLCCISKYPATIQDYEEKFQYKKLFLPEHQFECRYMNDGISDHTETFELWYKYQPKIYEIHYKLDSSTGIDAGSFARTPSMLKEIL